MDKVFIEALEIECTIGIHDWERRIKQPIVLDIEMGCDNRKPAASDAIEDAVDYTRVIDIARQIASEGNYRLLEACAGAIADQVLRELPVHSVTVKARKRIPSLRVAAVGVAVHRERAHGG